MRIDPPPSLPVQIGIMPDGDRGRRPARRTAGRALGVPRVAGDAVQIRAGPVGRTELGRRREPDEHRARGAQPRRLGAVVVGDLVAVQHRRVRVGPALDRDELLHAHRHAGPGPRVFAARDRGVDLGRASRARRRRRGSRTRSARGRSARRARGRPRAARPPSSSPLRTPSASSHASRSHSSVMRCPRSVAQSSYISRERVLDPAGEHFEILRTRRGRPTGRSATCRRTTGCRRRS